MKGTFQITPVSRPRSVSNFGPVRLETDQGDLTKIDKRVSGPSGEGHWPQVPYLCSAKALEFSFRVGHLCFTTPIA